MVKDFGGGGGVSKNTRDTKNLEEIKTNLPDGIKMPKDSNKKIVGRNQRSWPLRNANFAYE